MDLRYSYILNFVWGLVLLTGFVGYGRLTAAVLGLEKSDGSRWGMHAVWGMGAVLAAGGVLLCFSMASANILFAIGIFGFFFWLYYVVSDAASGKIFICRTDFLKNLPLWILMGIIYAASVSWPHQVDPNDDLLIYLTLPKRILQEGTLLEPFSYRRAGTFGGHSMLQAFMMSFGSEKNAHIVDIGWAKIVFFGLLSNFLSPLRKKHYFFYLLFVGIVMIAPVPRINTMSSMSGAIFILALLLQLEKFSLDTNKSILYYLPISLTCLGAATMRPNFAVQAIGILCCSALLFVLLKRNSWISVLRSTVIICLSLIVMLTPWMIVLYRSNGTIALPPFSGWTNLAFLDMSSRLGVFTDLANGVGFLLVPEVASLLCLFLFLRLSLAWPIAWAGAIATALCTLLTSYKCSIVIPSETYRYVFPMLLPAFVFVIGIWLIRKLDSNECWLNPSNLAIVSLTGFLLLQTHGMPGLQEVHAMIQSIPGQYQNSAPIVDKSALEFYKKLQGVVPENQKIFAIVDFPFLFDYRRNTIYNVDAIGGSSLPPGLPFFQGADKVRDYLLSHGIEYVIAVKFDKAVLMYTRNLWKKHNRPEWYFTEVWGKHALDLMDSVDELQLRNYTIAENDNYRVFRLKK